MNEGRHLSLACSVPDPCTCCVFFQGCFPRESQGFRVSPSKTAAPLLFPQSTHHGLIVHFLYLFSVSPFYIVQSNVCFLDLRCKSRVWHLSKPLLIEWMKVQILDYLHPLYLGMCLLLTQPLYRMTLDWPKRPVGFFHKMLWKNSKELCGQPNK